MTSGLLSALEFVILRSLLPCSYAQEQQNRSPKTLSSMSFPFVLTLLFGASFLQSLTHKHTHTHARGGVDILFLYLIA